MKKISLLGIGLFASVAAFAQTDIVKDVERQLKGSSPDYANALKEIQPALTNSETSGTMMPWFLAGKAAFGVYDNAYIREATGDPLTPEEKKAAGHALINAYNYYFTALPLDSLPDIKGKIKPKKSKEMIKELAGGYAQLRNAGVFLFDSQDYDGAYDAWELYVTLPDNPILGSSVPKADPDTIVGQIMFYQGVAKLSNNDNKAALDKMLATIPTGFKNLDLYRYALEAARRLDDSVTMLDIAQEGYDLYGTEDISFIGQLINARLAANDLTACYDLVNKAIESTSSDNATMISQLYDVKGFILEQDENLDGARDSFSEAIKYDPSFAKAYFDKARVIYNKALKLDEEATPETESSTVFPLLLEAAPLFEKAYDLDEGMSQIPGILFRLYYRLGAGYEEQSKYWETLQ